MYSNAIVRKPAAFVYHTAAFSTLHRRLPLSKSRCHHMRQQEVDCGVLVLFAFGCHLDCLRPRVRSQQTITMPPVVSCSPTRICPRPLSLLRWPVHAMPSKAVLVRGSVSIPVLKPTLNCGLLYGLCTYATRFAAEVRGVVAHDSKSGRTLCTSCCSAIGRPHCSVQRCYKTTSIATVCIGPRQIHLRGSPLLISSVRCSARKSLGVLVPSKARALQGSLYDEHSPR